MGLLLSLGRDPHRIDRVHTDKKSAAESNQAIFPTFLLARSRIAPQCFSLRGALHTLHPQSTVLRDSERHSHDGDKGVAKGARHHDEAIKRGRHRN